MDIPEGLVAIVSDKAGTGYLLIERGNYDPEQHELYSEGAAGAAEPEDATKPPEVSKPKRGRPKKKPE